MYYPYTEVKETKRVVSIGQIFFEIQPQMFKMYFWPSKLQNCMLNLICNFFNEKNCASTSVSLLKRSKLVVLQSPKRKFLPHFQKTFIATQKLSI